MGRRDRPRAGASATIVSSSSRAIGEQQRRRGAPAQARAAAERLADATAVAVLTGQQAGLFGGPVYTLLKAITALKLADAGIARARRARGGGLLDRSRRPRLGRSAIVHRPRRAISSAGPSPCRSVPPAIRCRSPPSRSTTDVASVLAELEQTLPPTEFRDALLADLRAAYQPGTGMAEAFGRWMERVLGERGLVVYDASDPATKPLVGPVFARELSTPGQTATGRVEGRRRSRRTRLPRAGAAGRRQPGAVPAG